MTSSTGDGGRKKAPTRKDVARRSRSFAKIESENEDSENKIVSAKMGVGRRKYDWERAERTFVEGLQRGNGGEVWYPNLVELATLLDLPLNRTRDRSAALRWTAKRQTHQLEVAKEHNRKRALQLALEGTKFDENSLTAAKLGVAMVTKRLSEIAQESQGWELRRADARARLERGLPVDKSDLRSPIYHQELVNLASALQTYQTVGMKALGTDVQRHEVSGPQGGPIEQAITVSDELTRDDPDRMAALLRAMADSKLINLNIVDADDEDVIDTEVEDDAE